MSNVRPAKPLIVLAEKISTPPFTAEGRKEAGDLLRQVQNGTIPPFPANRPMPSVGSDIHELRVRDAGHNWRIAYRIDADAIVVAIVFPKTTEKTPKRIVDLIKSRLKRYDAL